MSRKTHGTCSLGRIVNKGHGTLRSSRMQGTPEERSQVVVGEDTAEDNLPGGIPLVVPRTFGLETNGGQYFSKPRRCPAENPHRSHRNCQKDSQLDGGNLGTRKELHPKRS